MLRLFNEKNFESKERKRKKEKEKENRKHKNYDICGKY